MLMILPDAQRDHVLGAVDARDRLVEADWRPEMRLQRRMAYEVVATERLLDHDQIERVELGEMVSVGERVRGVRVGHEMHRRGRALRAPRARTRRRRRAGSSS